MLLRASKRSIEGASDGNDTAPRRDVTENHTNNALS